jgi:hypothetical protein
MWLKITLSKNAALLNILTTMSDRGIPLQIKKLGDMMQIFEAMGEIHQ